MQDDGKILSITDYLSKDELSLLQATANDSVEAYTVLYKRYLPRVFNYIMVFTNHDKHRSEEITQEVFISIWEKRKNLIAIKNFEAYIKRSAKNRLLNVLKHDEFLQRLHDKIQTPDFSLDTSDAIDFKEYFNVAEEAIHMLPDKRKLVFLLSTREGLSLDQIASILSVSKSRVKQQLYQAIAFVKDHLRSK